MKWNFFKRSILSKLILSTLLVVVVATVSVSLGIYFTVLDDLQKSMGKRLKYVATTASLMVDNDFHDKLVGLYNSGLDPTDITKTDEFKEISSTLRKIKNANELQQDIYTVIRPDWAPEQMVFITMSNEKPYLGNALDINSDLKKVLETGDPRYSNIYTDHEGKWISGFAPIKDSEGNVKAVLEVDYDVTNEVKAVQLSLLKKSLLWMTFGISLSIIITLFVSKQLSKPISELKNETKKPINKNWGENLSDHIQDEIGDLIRSMKGMVGEIIQSREQLEEYANTLEKKVEERTYELNSVNLKLEAMLNALGQGLLLINENGTIDPLYSSITTKMLDADLKQASFADLFQKNHNTLRGLKVVFSGKLPFEDSVDVLPRDLKKQETSSTYKIKYLPIYGGKKKLEQLLLVITDVTKEVENRKLLKQKEEEINRFVCIYTRQKELAQFLSGAKSRLEKIEEDVNNKSIDRNDIFRDVHTIKGEASTYFATQLADYAHDLESELLEGGIENFNTPDNLNRLKKAADEMKNLLLNYVDYVNSKLPYNIEREKQVEISYNDFKKVLHSIQDDKIQNEYIHRFLYEDLKDKFLDYNKTVVDLGEKLNKNVAPLKISTNNIKIDPEQYDEVFQSLNHYFRNILDHGIEDPLTRKEKGKPKEATIEISAEIKDDKIHMEIKDDGKGIDPEVIKDKLINLGLGDIPTSNHEIIQKIFMPGFSTAEQVSNVSGRGVGMDAIRSCVEENKGKVEIHSVIDKGTKLIIELPYTKGSEV